MNLKKQKKNRLQVIHLLMASVLIVFGIFAFRFAYIMIGGNVDNVNLVQRAKSQFQQNQIIPAKRGNIYDVNGNVIAANGTSYSLYAVLTDEWVAQGGKPNNVEPSQKEHIAEVLSQNIKLSKKRILEILNTSHVSQVEFGSAGQNLTLEQKNKIEKEHLQGIYFAEQPGRFYPNPVFASNLLGYTKYNDIQNLLDGQTGIEKAQNTVLQGSNGYQEEKQSNLIDFNAKSQEVEDGKDVYTTIDSRLQAYLEKLMDDVYKRTKPKEMTAMLVSPKTGAILAATQRPTFNLQSLDGLDKSWKNLLVEEPYEPGSTIKVLTFAAAIQEGVLDPNATYLSGKIKVGGGVVNDVKVGGWGTITELDGIVRSSNVLAVKLVQAMGYDKWKEYLLEFGMGQRPNSGLPNESEGLISYSNELQKANTGFGQAISVTPWQMVQAFSAIGNNGTMMKLHYISKKQSADGKMINTVPEEKGQPITPETAKTLLGYLTQVVDSDHGTGHVYKIPGYEIAAKTGTAEIYDSKSGKYLTGELQHTYSVVGFLPADNPQYVLYLTTKEPQIATESYPAMDLAQIFVPLAQRALEYAGIAPTKPEELKKAN